MYKGDLHRGVNFSMQRHQLNFGSTSALHIVGLRSNPFEVPAKDSGIGRNDSPSSGCLGYFLDLSSSSFDCILWYGEPCLLWNV